MSDEEGLESLLRYAREDRVGLSVVVAMAAAKVGEGATFTETTAALLSVVSALIDRGAVPGDLVGEDRDFVAWPGSKDEVLSRLACEVKALGEFPATGELCWIHDPAATA
ncbi:hypothetical protein [Amycolatopsis decaplanina]|uniref:Uncharacterized protein n=1 Tax=Amycolatopsis decaplanina DSM 44594 TaxID=1284240 RepID=M2YT75_9PSEU|nr:hypothetical protein [Amycolatopsis decaplanina]EME65125.1 hypothetical protein H074_00657 [Amycolatopsis decaplanina DSM 44594]